MSFLMGKLSHQLFILLLPNFLGQIIGIVFMHYYTAKYIARVHAHNGRLLYLFVRKRMRNARSVLKIALYVEKFCTTKKYGIRYGKGGLISMSAFGKVSKNNIFLIFLKIFLFCFHTRPFGSTPVLSSSATNCGAFTSTNERLCD